MEIKKGDRFRCIKSIPSMYTEGKEYISEFNNSLVSDTGYKRSSWNNVQNFNKHFVKIGPTDSPTSPSHYKAYDIEAIEMMIRIWGKQRVAEWCEITAFKYRCRVGMKDDVQQDLKKEAYYLAKWKELRDDVTG